MTSEQLAEIRARSEAATPGPWGWEQVPSLALPPTDVDFVIHARTDIPALLDYIEELQAEMEKHCTEHAQAISDLLNQVI